MNEIDVTELGTIDDRAVWQVNAAIGSGREDLAGELADAYAEAVLALLTEAVH